MNECDQVRIVAHVSQLGPGVAVVDVDRGGAELARGEQRLDGLDGVARVEPDVVPWAGPESGQVVSEPVDALVEFGVGHLAVAAGHRRAFAECIGSMLEEVGKVQGHGNETRTCYCSGQPSSRAQSEEISPL
jgi:hypothetical protein